MWFVLFLVMAMTNHKLFFKEFQTYLFYFVNYGRNRSDGNLVVKVSNLVVADFSIVASKLGRWLNTV